MAILSKPMLAALAALFAALIARAAPAPVERRDLGIKTVIEGKVHYIWEIDAAEEERLSQLLNTDFSRFGIHGTRLDGPKLQCHVCDKLSGFDDFVHNALADGVHSKDFIIKVMETKRDENPSPPHELRCMNCNIPYREKRSTAGLTDSVTNLAKRGWAENFGWTYEKRSPVEDEASQPENKDPVAKRSWPENFSWTYEKRSLVGDEASQPENKDPVAKRSWPENFGWTYEKRADGPSYQA